MKPVIITRVRKFFSITTVYNSLNKKACRLFIDYVKLLRGLYFTKLDL